MELGVLFCDQVGSTALLTRLGDALAEEVRRDFFQALHQSADVCRGEVVKGSGDGLMVIFRGGPGDALDCGELMIRKVARLATRELWSEVALRVGVTYGDAVFDRDDWYGAAVNLAARLCAAAVPGQIVATVVAVHTVAGEAHWQSLDPMTLKGFPDPVPVTGRHVDCTDVPSWPTAVELDAQGAVPFVGRQDALQVLNEAWAASRTGDRQDLVVGGSAGVGTSRLLAEFIGHHGETGAVLSAHQSGDVDWLGQLLRSHAAIISVQQLRDDAGPDAAALAALCPLIGLRLQVPAVEPTEPAEALLLRLLNRITRRAPVLVLLDGVTPPRPPAMPGRSLLVTAGRLEANASRSEKTIVLGPLEPVDVAIMVDPAVPAGCSWRPELDGLIVAETDGVARDVVAVLDGFTTGQTLTPSAAFDSVRRAVPYKGLQVFGGEDTVRFYGRDRAVEQVMSGLAEHSFIAVVGSSGSGKSSVIRAGCLPKLTRQDQQLIVTAPGEDPLRTLAVAWARATGTDADALHQQLLVDPTALARIEPSTRGTILIVDQLEESFTLCSDEQARDQYLRVITQPIPGLRVLATLRGDFYGRASEHPELAEALRTGTVLMPPPTRAELRAVIEQPARAAGLRLEPGLSDQILTDITDRPGSLPLLSHALRETWRRRRGRTLTVADYHEAGGATGAIARTADTVFEQFTDAERESAKRIFLRLTALGEGAEDSRRRVPVELLAGSDVNQRVLHTLTAARLVTADTDASGQDVDELAHEALLREWPRLRGWLDEDRDELRVLAQLETSARDWDSAGQPETELYSGRRLEAAETISSDKLNDRERSYLTASLRRREAARRAARRSRLRLQSFAIVVVILLIISTVAGVVAVKKSNDAQKKTRQAQQQAQLSSAQNLTTQAKDQLATQPELSMLLAAEAQKLHDSPQTRAALLSAVATAPHLARISHRFDNDMKDFGLSPDGKVAASLEGSNGGSTLTGKLWDFSSQTLIATIKGDPAAVTGLQPIAGAAFSSKGLLAVAMEDGLVRLFDEHSGKPRGPALRIPKPVSLNGPALAFSPNGNMLALADLGRGRFFRWRLSDGTLLNSNTNLPANSGLSSSIAFSADGKRLALVEGNPATVHIINPATGADSGPVIATHQDGAALAYSPDGREVAIAPLNTEAARPGTGDVIVVDTSNGKSKTYPGIGFVGHDVGSGIGGPIPRIGLTYSPDGKYLAVGNGYGKATVLRVRDGLTTTLGLSGANLISLNFLPTGDQVVTATPGEVLTWNIAANTTLPDHGQGDWGPTDLNVAVDLKRKRFMVAGADQRVHVWSTETLRPIGVSAKLGQFISNLAVDPETGDIAAALAENGVDVLQSTAPFKLISHLVDPGTFIGLIAYSPSGKQLAGAAGLNERDEVVVVYDLGKSDHPAYTVRTGDAFTEGPVRWSRDGTRILVGTDPILATVDTRTRRVVAKQSLPPEDGAVVQIELANDGSFVASTTGPVQGEGGNAHVIFSTPSGMPSRRADLLWSPQVFVTLSPDGRLLAATGGAGLGLFAQPSGQQLLDPIPDPIEYDSPGQPSRAADFDFQSEIHFLDSHRILVVFKDQFGIIDIDPGRLQVSACSIVGRNLTRQEFSQFLGSEPYHRTCPQWPAGI